MKVEDPNTVFIQRVIHNRNPNPGKVHTQTKNPNNHKKAGHTGKIAIHWTGKKSKNMKKRDMKPRMLGIAV